MPSCVNNNFNFFGSGLSGLGYKNQVKQAEQKIVREFEQLKKLVDRSSLDKKPLLIKFLSEIGKKYSSKLIFVPYRHSSLKP